MEIKDIFKVKQKIKGDRVSLLTSKVDHVETAAVETHAHFPNIVATLSSVQSANSYI